MAIFSPAGGGLPRQNVSGITLTEGAQQQPVMRAPMGNRAGTQRQAVKSASTAAIGSVRVTGGAGGNHKGHSPVSSGGYQSLDQLILFLDATYDELPP